MNVEWHKQQSLGNRDYDVRVIAGDKNQRRPTPPHGCFPKRRTSPRCNLLIRIVKGIHAVALECIKREGWLPWHRPLNLSEETSKPPQEVKLHRRVVAEW